MSRPFDLEAFDDESFATTGVADGTLGSTGLGEFSLGASDSLDPEPGSIVTLVGSASGASTTVGLLSAAVGLSGASAGVAATAGLLVRVVSVVGASSGVSTADGEVMTDVVLLAGAASGVGATTGTLSAVRAMGAYTDGISTASGSLSAVVALAGTSAGASTAVARLATHLIGSSAGAATATGSLSRLVPLAGSSAGIATTVGVLAKDVLLAGSSAGAATTTSFLTTPQSVSLQGISSGRSTPVGLLSGGTVVTGVEVVSPQIGDVTTAPSGAGTSTVTVSDGSLFSVGQYIIIGEYSYLIASIAGDVLTLTSPLLAPVGSGDEVHGIVTLPINNLGYALGHQTLVDLEALAANEAITVPMQNRHPVYVRGQPMPRAITMTVYFTATTTQQRRADYDALATALDSLSGLVTLRWTAGDGVYREVIVIATSFSPDSWFHRATAALLSPESYSRVAA